MKFFTSFYVIVTAKLVFSSQCHGGYFSDEHKKCVDCPEHCLLCDSSKMCLSCEDGYWGNICELPCSRCQPKTSCEKTNGFCFVKCKDGYTGILCDAFCNDKCLTCDRMDASLCDLCALGRYGESCDKHCPEFCDNNTCNDSGNCTHACDSGYWGPKCKNKCSSNCKQSSCNTKTGACNDGCKSDSVGGRCDSGNKGEKNDEKAANEKEGQTSNDDKENEASPQGGEIWSVILIVVAVLIFIVSVVVCVVYRKERNKTEGAKQVSDRSLCNLRRKRLTRQGKLKSPAEILLVDVTETKTSKDSGVGSQESPPTSLTQDTETDLSLTHRLLHETREAPVPFFEEAPSPSVKNYTESAESSVCENRTGLEAEALSLKSLSVRHFSVLSGTKAYIICKDPRKSLTDSVFWKLVWQEGCSIIVKLSRAIEETAERRYWPEKNKDIKYGDIKVDNEGVLFFDGYRHRTLAIAMTEQREVQQMQFTEWPPDKLPEDVKCLVQFRQEVNKLGETFHGPLLVHCSDGFSRSCVFVAMDLLLDEMEKKYHDDIGTILIQLEEKCLITTTHHRDFLRRSWDILRTEISTKEASYESTNKALTGVSISTPV